MDLDRAVDRLAYAIREEQDRKVVFVTGSGISFPNVPSTKEIVEEFLAELGKKGGELRLRISSLDDSERYQEAARELKHRRGDRVVANVVRKCVVKSLKPEFQAPQAASYVPLPQDWNIPPAQRSLARLYRAIPAQQRGSIFTTNFDPLTEAAFATEGIQTTSLSTPGSQAFPIDTVFGTLAVFHLHGYWEKNATLSTVDQLRIERPGVEDMIRAHMANTVVVVLGYGGWDDSFTRALIRMIRGGQMAALQTEVIWLSYGSEIEMRGHSVLSEIKDEAGVNLYYNIEAVAFLDALITEVGVVPRKSVVNYQGWSAPAIVAAHMAQGVDISKFIDGAQPDWLTAQAVPMLDNSAKVRDKVFAQLDGYGCPVLILTGPTGEGKSTALKQVAADVSEKYPDTAVLYRELSAPRIAPEWVDHLMRSHDTSVLVVDDADLVLDQIDYALREANKDGSGRIVWVLAMHSAVKNSSKMQKVLAGLNYEEYEFSEMSETDASKIADVWTHSNVLPEQYRGYATDDIAAIIGDASYSVHGRSLFGSILHLWQGDDLLDRVGEMSRKIAPMQISGISFRHLLNCIAVMQVAWDLEETEGRGIGMAVLGELARVRSRDVLQLIVNPLGREVGLSHVDERVYVRHPSIAEAIFNLLEDSDELCDVVRDIGRVGAQLRFSPEGNAAGVNEAYRLCTRLEDEASLAASFGAVQAAPGKLEPRVTEIATLRRAKNLEAARDYAKAVEKHLGDYGDRLGKQRGFYIEWAVVERKLGHLDDSLSLALCAVSDEVSGHIWGDTIEYAFVNIATCAESLTRAGREGASDLMRVSGNILAAMGRFDGPAQKYARSGDYKSILDMVVAFRRLGEKVSGTRHSYRKLQAAIMKSISFL